MVIGFGKRGGLVFSLGLLLVAACSSRREFATMDSGTGGMAAASGGGSKTDDGGSKASGDGAASAAAGDAAGGSDNSSGGPSSGGKGGMSVAEPQPTGFACGENADCQTGKCLDGVCCESACGDCKACSNALTGEDDGTCAPVLAGKDPHDACDDETASNQCGNDGTCDGRGACAKVAASHVCAKAGCTADGKSFVPATTCDRDGSGRCTTALPQDCAGFPCTETGCAKPCTRQTDCDTGNYCDLGTGKCATQKPDGAPATNDSECASGVVSDGVCCNEACAGQCQSCKATPGTCKAVTSPRTPCGGSGTCGTKKCDGTSPSCVLPGNEVACPATCSGDLKAKLITSCNGSGACGTAQSVGCGSSEYCASGACKAKLGNDTAGCMGAVTCSSGNCSTSPTGGGTMCCASNLQNCAQGCYNLTSDAEHCGSCDGACGPNKKCSASLCACKGAKLSCNACGSWDFESNTVERWVVPSWAAPLNIQTRATPSGAPFGGKYSLAFDVALSNGVGATVWVPLCSNAGTGADISTMAVYVYMKGPTYPNGKDLAVGMDSDGAQTGAGMGLSLTANKWVQSTREFNSTTANYLSLSFFPFGDWTGTIYVDQVELTP